MALPLRPMLSETEVAEGYNRIGKHMGSLHPSNLAYVGSRTSASLARVHSLANTPRPTKVNPLNIMQQIVRPYI